MAAPDERGRAQSRLFKKSSGLPLSTTQHKDDEFIHIVEWLGTTRELIIHAHKLAKTHKTVPMRRKDALIRGFEYLLLGKHTLGYLVLIF